MISLKDISAICHVSVPTVSKALNGRHDVSEKTRQKVLQAARELHYSGVPDTGSGSVLQSCTMNLGILMPPYFESTDPDGNLLYEDVRKVQILHGFCETAMRAGFDLTLLNIDDLAVWQMSYEARCRYRRVDGLCVFARGTAMYEERMMELFLTGLPVVTLDQVVDGHTAVLTDHSGGMEALAKSIAGAGCRRIAYIEKKSCSGGKYLPLFKKYAAETGITVHEGYIRRAGQDTESVYREVADLMSRPEMPDGFLFSGDFEVRELRRDIISRIGSSYGRIPVFLYGGYGADSEMADPIVSVGEDNTMLGRTAAQSLIFAILHPEMAVGETVYVPMIFRDGGLTAKTCR